MWTMPDTRSRQWALLAHTESALSLADLAQHCIHLTVASFSLVQAVRASVADSRPRRSGAALCRRRRLAADAALKSRAGSSTLPLRPN